MDNIILIAFGLAVGLVFVIYAATKLTRLRQAFLVPEGHAGLLYNKSKFVETLRAGRHIRWGRYYSVQPQDVRKALMPVVGQEVLTADNVAVRLSLLVAYQVTDPATAAHETQNWEADVYSAAQLAVRTVVHALAIEVVLGQCHEMAPKLLALVKPKAEPVGVTVHGVQVRDVMVAPDLKRAFADVLKARQEGQAALERARGESAALRNLANAARVMEGNPALMNLRLMQSIGSAQNAGSTLVVGVPGGFVPLKARPTPGVAETGEGT